MRILIHEFVTGGGWFSVDRETPSGSLLAEGAAMRAALAADFADVEGCQVHLLHDVRLPAPTLAGVTCHEVTSAVAERERLARLSAHADWTVLIAPEFDSHLLERARLVERAGGRLLSPSADVVSLAADKHLTAEHLASRGVRVPPGVALAGGERLPIEFSYPAVLKLRDGAGSLGVRFVRTPAEAAPDDPSRLEAFCGGSPASVACLCGPEEVVPLSPCRQHLADDGSFAYLGGSLPMTAGHAERARALAVRAVRTLPEPRGYVGVDLVLGEDSAGSQDFVIEINPRLTTSYVGLRRLSRVNLAGQMIAVAEGRAAELCWNASRVQFSSSGVSHVSPAGGTVS